MPVASTAQEIQARRDLVFLVLAGLFLGTLGMLNILGLTRFLVLGQIGSWPIVVAIGALPYPVTFLCTDLISELWGERKACLLYTSPSPRDKRQSRMPSSA